MNFKSILVLGLSVATLGLTLPAHADTKTDTGNVIDTNQNAVVTGNDNAVNQNMKTRVTNTQTGRPTGSSTGTSINSNQDADVLGNRNEVNQKTNTRIDNTQRRR